MSWRPVSHVRAGTGVAPGAGDTDGDTWAAPSLPVTATVSVAKAAANARRPAVEGSTHRTIEGPEGAASETPAAPAGRTWPTSAGSWPRRYA